MATVRSTTLDSRPVPISRRRVWDRGNSGTHGRVVAWSSVSSASGREKWRNVWRRIGVHRSDGVGSDSPGSPWETSNNTLLAHDSLYSGTGLSLDPGVLLRTTHPSFLPPLLGTLAAFIRRSVDGRGHFYSHFSCFRLSVTIIATIAGHCCTRDRLKRY